MPPPADVVAVCEPADVVVTVPMNRWRDWLAEGNLPDQTEWPCYFCKATGLDLDVAGRPCEHCHGRGQQRTTDEPEWSFFLGGRPPKIEPGGRCYIVAHGRLRGYSPLYAIDCYDRGFAFVRRGGAVACTIAQPIRGFQGWRRRFWDRDEEHRFPDWATEGVTR